MAARGGAGRRAEKVPRKPLGEGGGLFDSAKWLQDRARSAQPAERAASIASLAMEFSVEIHSIPHSNSALITDENMSHGVC